MMEEYLTIGELAKIFDMDVQLLRYYDSKGLLVPQKRNAENNRRLYHFDQIYPLATIRYLRKLGYPLNRIEKFVHANGLKENMETLVEQSHALQQKCDELMATIQIIQNKIDFSEREREASAPGKFFTREYPDRPFLHIGQELNLFTHELFYFYPTVGFYQHDEKWFGAYIYNDDPHSAQDLPEKFVDAEQLSYIPGGKYLCGYHYGAYQTIQDSIDCLYAAGEGMKLDDCVVTLNIVDQCFDGHPVNYITALEVRILDA